MSKQRKMFDVRPGQHRPKHIRNGAIFAILGTLFVYVLYFKPAIPVISSKGEVVAASFIDGTNIRPNYTPVRVSGIEVGQVTSLERQADGRGVDIEMELEDKGVEVKSDARATSRWRTLLGRNHYIDLEPGSESAPELNGKIPEGQTGAQTELDTALEPFDASGRSGLRNVIEEFERGFRSPEQIRSTVNSVQPAFRELAPALQALRGTEHGDLPNTIRQTSRAMGALARDQVALGDLVTNGRVALGVTAARRSDLGAFLRETPATLQQVRSTATRLRTTLDELDPVAEDLRPGFRVLDDAADEARATLIRAEPLLEDLRPALRDLDPALVSVREAATSGVPAVTGLQPTFDRTVDTFVPWLNERDEESKMKNFEALGPGVASASNALARGDKRGSLANFEGGSGEQLPMFSPCSADGLTDEYKAPEDKIQCELLATSIASIFTGEQPTKLRMLNRAVPDKVLKPLLDGSVKTVEQALRKNRSGK